MANKPPLVTHFVIGDKEYEANLTTDLLIDRGNLSEEYENHSVNFAWYATAVELSSDHELRAKVSIERAYARLDAQIRADLTNHNIKFTEKMVANTAITHPDYISLQEVYLDAKHNTGVLKAARDSMIHRKDMLISLGANYRAEGRSDVSLRGEHYNTQK